MKTNTRIIVGVLVAIIAGWFSLRYFKVVDFYLISSAAMEPVFPTSCQVVSYMSSNHKVYQAVTFRNKLLERQEMHLMRIAGLEGDTVELRDGYLWVNGRLMDKKGRLQFTYELPDTLIDANYNAFSALDEMHRFTGPEHVQLVNLAEKDVKNWVGLDSAKKHDPPLYNSPFADSSFTCLNFGPVVVPKHKCFMLGDNRNNSLDSRYYGFVGVKDVIGPVVKITD